MSLNSQNPSIKYVKYGASTTPLMRSEYFPLRHRVPRVDHGGEEFPHVNSLRRANPTDRVLPLPLYQ